MLLDVVVVVVVVPHQLLSTNVTPVVFEMSKDQVSELQRQVAEIQSVISNAM